MKDELFRDERVVMRYEIRKMRQQSAHRQISTSAHHSSTGCSGVFRISW